MEYISQQCKYLILHPLITLRNFNIHTHQSHSVCSIPSNTHQTEKRSRSHYTTHRLRSITAPRSIISPTVGLHAPSTRAEWLRHGTSLSLNLSFFYNGLDTYKIYDPWHTKAHIDTHSLELWQQHTRLLHRYYRTNVERARNNRRVESPTQTTSYNIDSRTVRVILLYCHDRARWIVCILYV